MRLELVSPRGWSGALKWRLGGPRACLASAQVRFKYSDPNFQSLSLMKRFAQGYKIIRGGKKTKEARCSWHHTSTFDYHLCACDITAVQVLRAKPSRSAPTVSWGEWLHRVQLAACHFTSSQTDVPGWEADQLLVPSPALSITRRAFSISAQLVSVNRSDKMALFVSI